MKIKIKKLLDKYGKLKFKSEKKAEKLLSDILALTTTKQERKEAIEYGLKLEAEN